MFSSVCRKLSISQQIWGSPMFRQYAKVLVRRPLKVFSVDGKEIKDDTPPATYAGMPRMQQHGDPWAPELERRILGDMEYVWLKDTDKRLKMLRLVSIHRKARTKKGLVALEGSRLVADALEAQANVKAIYFSKVESLEGLNLTGLEGRLFKVKHSQLEYVTSVTSPPGIMALVDISKGAILSSRIDHSELRPITLILDNIRDPGNMGTLLRSATAVGCHKILVTSGNVDIWDPKVLRAGAGCHFRTHILNNLKWTTIRELLSDNCILLLADNQRLASESNRVSDSPHLSGTDESDDDDASVNTNFKATHGTSNNSENAALVDAFSLDVGDASEIALVVGGETHGLSCDAYEAMAELGGKAVQLPMVSGVDSLNAAMAGTVLMYEIRRQIDLMLKTRWMEDGS